MYLRGLLNNGHPKKELPGLNAMPRIILGKLPQRRTSCLFLIQVASDVAWSRNVWGGLLACEIVEKEEGKKSNNAFMMIKKPLNTK